jgi:hypothetical protein
MVEATHDTVLCPARFFGALFYPVRLLKRGAAPTASPPSSTGSQDMDALDSFKMSPDKVEAPSTHSAVDIGNPDFKPEGDSRDEHVPPQVHNALQVINAGDVSRSEVIRVGRCIGLLLKARSATQRLRRP